MKDTLPHRKHLVAVDAFLPGENASGWVEFKEDPTHFPGHPILPASNILQALSEIAEIAIRSRFSLRRFAFLGFRIAIAIREKVSISSSLRLPVYAEKIANTLNSAGTPSRRHGKIKALLYNQDKNKVLAEIIISFKLQELSP